MIPHPSSIVRATNRWSYAFRGIARRWRTKPRCPCCHGDHASVVDRKFPFQLLSCGDCGILHRFPTETPEEMAAFYQSGYSQAGLTTDLPSPDELRELMDTGFAGSEKDATPILALFEALQVRPPARILDFGANWGYMTWQFRRCGYNATAYELSENRAAFGRQLGIEIATSSDFPSESFDIVFSSHVLEHVDDPLQVLKSQLGLVRRGGFVVALTPNGSLERRSTDPHGFHRHWGRVHPVLVGIEFIERSFPSLPSYVSSSRNPEPLAGWDQSNPKREPVTGGELVLVLRRP